jgi:hypothetical protein
MYALRKRSEFEGFEVFSIASMATVHYAIVSDFMVISPSQTLLQDVLRRKSNQELPQLATDAAFKRQLDGMTRPHSLVVWSKTSADLMSGVAGAAGSEMGGASDPFTPPDAAPDEGDPLRKRVDAVAKALQALDPALIVKHLPGGSLMGLSVDPAGIDLQIVSR